MLEARVIEFSNLSEIIKLEVHAAQKKYVAPNSVTVAQFHYEPSGWIRGLWFEDVAVGMIAMINPSIESPSYEEGDPTDGAYLWRLMIGADHQRKGYGRAAMEIIKTQSLAWHFDKLYTSIVPGDDTPMPFYEAVGMTPTGRMLGKEVELRMSLANQ